MGKQTIRNAVVAIGMASLMVFTDLAYADVTGKAVVIDGDTVKIGDSRIRLHGMDSPESAQTCMVGESQWSCGRSATDALIEMIGGF